MRGVEIWIFFSDDQINITEGKNEFKIKGLEQWTKKL
jgi:hypothetical protein